MSYFWPELSTQIQGHLGSHQMLKNVEFFNKKMEMLRKDKATQFEHENVFYPQGDLVAWLFFYSVNNSYSLFTSI